MSDFLSRLVERARGTASHVEPVIASRFAPAEPVERVESPVDTSTVATRKEPPMAPTAEPRRQPSPVATEELPTAAARSAWRPSEVSHVHGFAEPEKFLMPEQPLPSPQRDLADQPRLSPNNEPRSSVPASQSSITGRHPAAQPSASARAKNGSPALGKAFHALADAPHEPSVVRVTIGRIEVRAAPAPAVCDRKTPRPPGPKLTLDDYLKSRTEGAR